MAVVIPGEADALVVCVNSGSSSLKVAAFVGSIGAQRKVAEVVIESVGLAHGRLTFRRDDKRTERPVEAVDQRAALGLALEELRVAGLGPPSAVGHRVVHGGSAHEAPERVGPELLTSLRELSALAPLHMPAAIAGIEAIAAELPDVPQVACFDTAFHHTLPESARRLPLPRRFSEVRRYGFHGLSYEYIVSALQPAVPPRLIVAHLGNGASLAAIQDGQSVDTTMSFTPTGGIPMGTRCGDLDPGALLYLARKYGLSLDALDHLVDRESGLLGIGGTSDVKELLERCGADPDARLALDVFARAVRKAIGSFAAVLGGVDMLVFTGGIGEHAAEVRAKACDGLDALGIVLDTARNAASVDPVSASGSRCTVRVMATDEDLVIARHVRAVLARRAGP